MTSKNGVNRSRRRPTHRSTRSQIELSRAHRHESNFSTVGKPKLSSGIQPKLEMRERLHDDFARLRPEGRSRAHLSELADTEASLKTVRLSVFEQIRGWCRSANWNRQGGPKACLPPLSRWHRSAGVTWSVIWRFRRRKDQVQDTQPES